jgi:2-polyprenyl-3-methyl-5-hydroxy-6-metoxy-1,4-benzoquinol methylase
VNKKEYNMTNNVHIKQGKDFVEYHKVVSKLADKYIPVGGTMLDIGCGMGNIEFILNSNRADIKMVVADPYENCLIETKRKVNSVKTINIGTECIDRDSLGDEYDVVIMCHSLEHMKCPALACEQAMKLVKHGGHLILAVPNPVRPDVIFGNIFRRHYVNKGHVYSWDKSHWINFLEEILSFNVVEYANDTVYIFGKLRAFKLFRVILRPLEVILCKTLPWFSFSNIAVISKK